ncbi:MAG: BofC C-terminal domain-containing protein [Lachnospiraceae bacterium]|nr:BofC C-terminal domain-containing protein [Lachnospiraceae bacterium]MBQ8548823.1 BofC C-terminal domain-containing protein [Lachnospiraceae bacterium]
MKKIGIYLGSFAAISLMFCLCYYASYKNALKDFNRKAKEQENSLYSELEKISEENKTLLNRLAKQEDEMAELTALQEEQESIAAGVIAHNTVLPTVSYVEETYNMVTGQLDSVAKTAPGFLIGMTREELSAYLTNYMDKLSLAEYEAGLLSYEIVSFSENKVVLRKTYDASKVPYKFYVNITDGMVTVFYSDMESVFEYTHIPAVDLAEEDRLALIEGIYVKDREELYSILEGFSS